LTFKVKLGIIGYLKRKGDNMKKVKYLMKQYGEYVYTARDIYEVYTGQEYDKDADAGCIRGYDSWQPAPKKLWAVEEIEIPEWMTPEEYITYKIEWKYYVKIGGIEELGRDAFFKLNKLGGVLRVAAIKLLKTKKFRSKFRESLANQLKKWISGEVDYSLPFSYKQEKALVTGYDRIEAKRAGVIA
jgi:hypothetical protein